MEENKENILELRTINQLRESFFFIPSYQRGFRWSDKEVVDLLSDISDFNPREIDNTEDKSWYCLQPLVIQKRDENDFEVIDGQQRLTTIYLILYYLNQRYTPDNRDRIFELSYQTRQGSSVFLKELDKDNIDESNVDFYHISTAYRTIANWFTEQIDFDLNNFESKFKFNTKVIWYETSETDPIAVFTRINIGKIPLTNAELIKALFLNSSNFDNNKETRVFLKQIEIATEWDRIEHSLQNDRFWYFLNGSRQLTNRIELIFNLMNDQSEGDDVYATFRFFNEKFKNKTQETIEKNWLEIKQCYQTFEEWFNERELYHKIGFLLALKETSLNELLTASSNVTKAQFKKHLDNIIVEKLKKVSLENLQYGDKDVKPLLLLYNIQTMLNNEKDNSVFPFDLYNLGNWDIEHITSINDTIPEGSHREQWLEDAQLFIDDSSLKKAVETFDVSNGADEEFEELFNKVVEHFNKDVVDKDLNDISNLALLDSETNRGYKNAVFPIKRMTIIKREKEGTFIPIGTKNVFLKYFSEYPPRYPFGLKRIEKTTLRIYKVF